MNVVPMTPLTTVKVLKNVPLDLSNTDTLKFSSVSEQIIYFNGKVEYTFTNCTPVKLQNKIRIPKPADKLYNCNYIMFQNQNFENRWFYAFITSIDFVNVNMCEVGIELDVLQTYQFEWNIKPSYVLREHANSDNIGDNLVTESVDLGYYREETAEKTTYFNSYVAVVATSYDPTQEKLGGYVGGLFTGLKYVPALVDNPDQVQSLVDLLENITKANKSDSITSIFMMPSMFYTSEDIPISLRFDAKKEQSKLGNYTPRNKKLLTYPYNYLYVFTPDGANSIYRYEFFQNTDSCGFNLLCAMSCNPEIVLEPIAYQKQQFNIDESLTMSGFPQCSYAIDSFKAYLSQNATSIGLGLLGTVATGGVGAILSGASQINNVVMASQKPPQVRGQQGSSTFTGVREKNFYFVNKHISEEYAKIIDGYFDMYGYATNKVKVPNLTGRPYWNYVQTKDAKILGNIPFDDLKKIKDIFNRGVTFWHGDWVGNYELDNSI